MANLIYKAYNRSLYPMYLYRFCDLNRYRNLISPEKSILIFSNPRGGSTWLAELFRTLPRSAMIWEPLRRYKIKEFNDLNFFWHQPIPENADWPEAKKVIKRLLNIEIKSRSLYFHNDLLSFPFSKYFIFKFCYGNMMLPWVVKNFNVKPVLLVRHPCAVVNSQLRHDSWEGLKNKKPTYEIEDFPFNEEYLRYKDIIKNVKTVEENMAATWAFTMINTVLNTNNDEKWITVAYESLVNNFEAEIHRIFNRLDIDIPEEIYSKKLNPSKTTENGSVHFIQKGTQLNAWKNTLTSNQINNIMNIVREFGITFYDESPEPDYAKIYKA